MLRATAYNIFFEAKIFKHLNAFLSSNGFSQIFILCDSNTLEHCLPVLIRQCKKLRSAAIIETEPGEESKDIDVCRHIWHTLLDEQADKNALLINLGGGVITDLGGFVAAVYKRGISFIHLPTSLLGMADASVGTKTGVDLAQVKNVLGTFSSPRAVFIYPDFLKTLGARHFQNGLAEIYKIALVYDKKFYHQLETMSVQEALTKAVGLKNKIVKQDPLDRDLRKILNFGHTIGHALESCRLDLPGTLLHGEAVVAGMIIESHLAMQKKMISKKDFDALTARLLSVFHIPELSDITFDRLLTYIRNDKKRTAGKLSFALINGIGVCKPAVTCTTTQIKKAFDTFKQIQA